MSDAAVARNEVLSRDAAARPSWLARLAHNRNIGVGAVILAVVMLARCSPASPPLTIPGGSTRPSA